MEEHYPENHIRVLRILLGDRIVYSIDHYARLNGEPGDCEGPGTGSYRLCYKRLGKCTAVIAVTPAGAELVNLRLETGPDGDPGPVEARRICVEEAGRILEGMLAPQRG